MSLVPGASNAPLANLASSFAEQPRHTCVAHRVGPGWRRVRPATHRCGRPRPLAIVWLLGEGLDQRAARERGAVPGPRHTSSDQMPRRAGRNASNAGLQRDRLWGAYHAALRDGWAGRPPRAPAVCSLGVVHADTFDDVRGCLGRGGVQGRHSLARASDRSGGRHGSATRCWRCSTGPGATHPIPAVVPSRRGLARATDARSVPPR